MRLRNLVQIGLWPSDLPQGFRPSIPDLEGQTLIAIGDAPQPWGPGGEARPLSRF